MSLRSQNFVRSAVGVFLCFILLLAFYIAKKGLEKERLIEELLKKALVANLSQADSPALPAPFSLKETRGFVATSPLHQPSLNILYYLCAAERCDIDEEKLVAALRELGWRSTPAVQNSLAAAVAKEDVKTALQDLDALLRRGQFTEQGIRSLQSIELIDEGRNRIVDLILDSPPWMDLYLRDRGFAETENGRSARLELLGQASARGASIGEEILISNSRSMVQFGDPDRAWDVFSSEIQKTLPSNHLAFDPDFESYRNAIARGEPEWPFGWRLSESPGTSQTLGREGLKFRWNGMGNPIFLAQRVNTEGQLDGRVLVSLRDESQVRDVGPHLRLYVQCLDGGPVFRTRGKPVQGGDIDFEWELNRECTFIDLQIRGLGPIGTRSLDFEFQRVYAPRLDRSPTP